MKIPVESSQSSKSEKVSVRRGRLALGAAAMSVVAVAGIAHAHDAHADNKKDIPVQVSTPGTTPAVETHKEYIAQPGDTLIGISERAEPNLDPIKEYKVIEQNQPDHSAEIYAGQPIELPADSDIGRTVPGPFENSGQQ